MIKNNKMKILVTGGAGFIGSHLVDELLDQGHEVLVVDDLSAGYEKNVNPKAAFKKIDITDDKLSDLVADFSPNIIFHLAAQKYVKVSMDRPDVDAQINIVGSLKLFKAAIENKVNKFIFISTGGAIYDEHDTIPSTEQSKASPISPYALSKLTFENYLAMLAGEKMDWTVLRLANVYGPRQDPYGEGGVVAIFSTSIVKNQNIFINGDGKQTRDYVYVKDVVNALLKSMEAKKGIYNIGTTIETDVVDLVELIKKISKKDIKLEHRDAIAGEVMRSSLDYQKAKKELDWQPQYNLETGLAETYQWFEDNL